MYLYWKDGKTNMWAGLNVAVNIHEIKCCVGFTLAQCVWHWPSITPKQGQRVMSVGGIWLSIIWFHLDNFILCQRQLNTCAAQLFLFFICLKLVLLTQFPASDDENICVWRKVYIVSQVGYMMTWASITNKLTIFTAILFVLEII